MALFIASNAPSVACPHCGFIHNTTCPTIKAIEYYPDGTTKRVEFKTRHDYYPDAPPVSADTSSPIVRDVYNTPVGQKRNWEE